MEPGQTAWMCSLARFYTGGRLINFGSGRIRVRVTCFLFIKFFNGSFKQKSVAIV